MKLWEVLKALDEGSKSSYEHSSGDSPSIVIFEKYTDGWQEIKQPVTWQEAIEAWAREGKDISCEDEYGTKIFRQREDKALKTRVETALNIDMVTHGTWYIED